VHSSVRSRTWRADAGGLAERDDHDEEQYAREAREAGVGEVEIAAQLAAFRLRDAAEQARELAGAAEEAADVAERERARADAAEDAAVAAEERAE
jgi:hypothetical protein